MPKLTDRQLQLAVYAVRFLSESLTEAYDPEEELNQTITPISPDWEGELDELIHDLKATNDA